MIVNKFILRKSCLLHTQCNIHNLFFHLRKGMFVSWMTSILEKEELNLKRNWRAEENSKRIVWWHRRPLIPPRICGLRASRRAPNSFSSGSHAMRHNACGIVSCASATISADVEIFSHVDIAVNTLGKGLSTFIGHVAMPHVHGIRRPNCRTRIL